MKRRDEITTILLIEDNPDDFEATQRSFKRAKLLNPVQWCASGEDGIDYLTRQGQYRDSPAVRRPSLILLDLNMPGIGGRAVLEFVKKDESLRSIPVIILTTSADEKDVEDCYAIGASTYIQKPVDFPSLVEAAARLRDYWFEVALLPKPEDQ